MFVHNLKNLIMEENSDPNIFQGLHVLLATIGALADDFQERSPPRKKMLYGIIIME